MRENLYREIDREREAQDLLWGGPERDDKHTQAEWVAILVRHLGLSMDDAGGLTPERYRRQLVRVAAVAVAAVESHDRLTGRQVVAQDFERGSGV